MSGQGTWLPLQWQRTPRREGEGRGGGNARGGEQCNNEITYGHQNKLTVKISPAAAVSVEMR